MAGIGFALRKLTQKDDLAGVVQGFLHASLVSTGPWIFTVLSLGGVFLLGSRVSTYEELYNFRLIIVYNFSISGVLSAPLVLLATRYLADRVYEKDVREAPGMMLGGMGTLYLLQLPFAIFLYFVYTNLEPGVRVAAFVNLSLTSTVWMAGVFLSALKCYQAVTLAFGMGMAVALGAAPALGQHWGTSGFLWGFNLGLALILFLLMARVFAEYPYDVVRPFHFFRSLREHWMIALGGLMYNLGIWIDKWIMWWFSPRSEVLTSKLRSFPDYDSALFLAYLSLVPSMALFVLSVETSFFERLSRFYESVRHHGNLARIREDHQRIKADLFQSGRNFLILEGCIWVTLSLLAPHIMDWLSVSPMQIGMFRIGLLGSVFHSLFLFMTIVLSYFNSNRVALNLQILFCVANLIFTALSLQWGMAYFGYGYFLAALSACVATFVILANQLEELPYRIFVTNNSSVSQ